MSVEYFLSKGFQPQNKSVVISGLDTFTVWAPTTSTRVVLTNLSVSNINAGTLAFYWGNLAGTKVAEFSLASSGNISPIIGIWNGTAFDRTLFGKASVSGTDGIRVNVTGFEVPSDQPLYPGA